LQITPKKVNGNGNYEAGSADCTQVLQNKIQVMGSCLQKESGGEGI